VIRKQISYSRHPDRQGLAPGVKSGGDEAAYPIRVGGAATSRLIRGGQNGEPGGLNSPRIEGIHRQIWTAVAESPDRNLIVIFWGNGERELGLGRGRRDSGGGGLASSGHRSGNQLKWSFGIGRGRKGGKAEPVKHLNIFLREERITTTELEGVKWPVWCRTPSGRAGRTTGRRGGGRGSCGEWVRTPVSPEPPTREAVGIWGSKGLDR
jgi:hypothetical protein